MTHHEEAIEEKTINTYPDTRIHTKIFNFIYRVTTKTE